MCAAISPSEPGSATAGRTLPDPVSSRRNPLVARIRQLHDAAGRRRSSALLLEGTHLLQEALRLGLRPELVLATEQWQARHPGLTGALLGATALRTASEAVLEAAATTRHPDGVVAILPTPRHTPAAAGTDFVLALDRLQDPGNLGTLLRTALAGGVQQVWLADGADPHQPKVLRASSGAALALPLERFDAEAMAERLTEVRAQGLQLVAAVLPTSGNPQPLPYWDLDWTRPTLLLLGNEGAGVDPALLDQVDVRVTIPHSPAVESLNVAMAAAPLLLERWRQLATSPGRGPRSLRG